MAAILPFKGFRYNTGKIDNLALVTTPPYDVISAEEQQKYYDLHENNIIRIELGKDFDSDDESNNKYVRAGNFLDSWIKDGILVQDKHPAFYIYEQEFAVSEWESLIRRGLIGLVKLSEFSEGIVLPHEHTMPKAKQDRFNLMTATSSNISQIFSLYSDSNDISSILNAYTSANSPDIDYINNQGITERVWVVTDNQLITQIIKLFDNKQLFIADGHHRYETALNYKNKQAFENPFHTGNELYNYVMMTLVDMDDPGLIVFPTHRVLKNLEQFDSASFLNFAEDFFEIDRIEFNTSYDTSYIPTQIKYSLEQKDTYGKSFGYYDGQGKWYYILTLKDESVVEKLLSGKPPAYRNLDVSVLQALILEHYFNIDSENLKNQTNLQYTRDVSQAIAWVNSNECNCAFFLNPTPVQQVKEISLANEKMPQKSTYFYPKLTTGLVINKL